MELVKRIDNVSKYLIYDNNLYYQKKGGVYLNGDLLKELPEDFFGEFYLYKGELIIQSNFGCFVYQNKTYNGYYNYLNQDSLTYLDSLENKIFQLNDHDKSLTIFDQPFYSFYEVWYLIEGKKLKAFSKNKNEILWEFDLLKLENENIPEEILISKILGQWNKQLLLACTHGYLLGLNVSTGKIEKLYHKTENFIVGGKAIKNLKDSSLFALDLTRDCLTAVFADKLLQIELNTDKIYIIDMANELYSEDISIFRQSINYGFDKTHIYTVGELIKNRNRNSLEDRCILAINRDNKKIDWKFILENDSINTDPPMVSDNYVYQLSSKGHLYVFEIRTIS